MALLCAMLRAGLSDDDAFAAFFATARGPALIHRRPGGAPAAYRRVIDDLGRARGLIDAQPLALRPPLRIDPAILASGPSIGPYAIAAGVLLAAHASEGGGDCFHQWIASRCRLPVQRA